MTKRAADEAADRLAHAVDPIEQAARDAAKKHGTHDGLRGDADAPLLEVAPRTPADEVEE